MSLVSHKPTDAKDSNPSEYSSYLLLFLNVRYVILLCSPLFPQMFLAVGSACELSPSLQLAIANHTFIHFKFQYWN